MLVNRAVLLEITIPATGFNIAGVLELNVETDPIKMSVVLIITFFLHKV